MKKVFLETSQNSQENNRARVPFLMKFIKKETLGQAFPVDFVKFLRTPFHIERLWWLLLNVETLSLYLSNISSSYKFGVV